MEFSTGVLILSFLKFQVLEFCTPSFNFFLSTQKPLITHGGFVLVMSELCYRCIVFYAGSAQMVWVQSTSLAEGVLCRSVCDTYMAGLGLEVI